MTMPLYVSMHNNTNTSRADVNATNFKHPYENYLNEQQAHLSNLTNLANESIKTPYVAYQNYMSALTKDPNNSAIWDNANNILHRYASNPNKFMEDYGAKSKPGFFSNIWERIQEEPGAFIGGALDIWNSINANNLAKDYTNLMRDSFNLQKQQYLDREDRAKQEFAALQSRRAGSSL